MAEKNLTPRPEPKNVKECDEQLCVLRVVARSGVDVHEFVDRVLDLRFLFALEEGFAHLPAVGK